MITFEVAKERDFYTNLNLFNLNEIDVEEKTPKESQGMVKHHEMIKQKLSES